MLSLDSRPFSFSKMIGQRGIRFELTERSKTLDYPSVMFMVGPSGTGKTTAALIVAALLNDTNPIVNDDKTKDPNPESPSSQSIIKEIFNCDVHLFDASSMKKEDILNIHDLAGKRPAFSRKRIIIIDEAQELSNAAKGATLKLLEKKRKDVHIILCTMEESSLKKEILSRGQVYKFRSPTSQDIATYLYSLVSDRVVPDEFISEGLLTIANNCDGSVRTAVQTFERCIYGGFYSQEEILEEFGFLSNEKLGYLLDLLLNRDPIVITELDKFGYENFFWKSFKILSSAIKFSLTKRTSQDWMLDGLKRITRNDVYIELYEAYIDFFEKGIRPHFQEPIFVFKLYKFLNRAKKTTTRRKTV